MVNLFEQITLFNHEQKYTFYRTAALFADCKIARQVESSPH